MTLALLLRLLGKSGLCGVDVLSKWTKAEGCVQEDYTQEREEEMPRRSAKSHRELIDTGRDKRFVRRDSKGRFDEVEDVGRSLAQDRRRAAKTKVPAGQGDRGDQKRKS